MIYKSETDDVTSSFFLSKKGTMSVGEGENRTLGAPIAQYLARATWLCSIDFILLLLFRRLLFLFACFVKTVCREAC